MQRIALGALAFAALTSCNGVKPVIRTVNDIAKEACALFFAEKQGISVEEAARGICATREVLDPFIREILKAQQVAGAAAGAAASPEADAAPTPAPEAPPPAN